MSLSPTPKPTTTLVDRFASWENFLAVLTLATIAYAVVGVPNFLSLFNISEAIAGASERALIVLPMVLLIIARQIDLSVASILALTSVIFGVMNRAGVPLPVAIVTAIFAGGLVRRFQRSSGDRSGASLVGRDAWNFGHVSRYRLHHFGFCIRQ